MGAISIGRSFPALSARPLERLSDERLATLVHRGDDEAFSILYERYRAPLSRYCRSIVGDPEDAGDAQQSAMLSALRALRARRLTGRVKPWLYRIAHNESITVLRRRRGHEPLDDRTPSPRTELQDLETWEQLLSDLRSLPGRQRGALLMRELGGLEYEEIGVALSMSAARARKLVFEARSALGDNVAGREDACVEVRLKLSDRDGRMLRGRRVRSHLEQCAPCAAFALTLRQRRRTYELIPVAPVLPIGGGLAAAAGGVTGGGIAAGGVAIGTGSSATALAVKAVAACAVCALAGAGVAFTGAHHAAPATKVARGLRTSTRPAAPRIERLRAARHAAAGVSAGRIHVRSVAPRGTTSAALAAYTPTRIASITVGAPHRRPARLPATTATPATPVSTPTAPAPTTTTPTASQAPAGQAPAGQAPAGQAPAGQAPAGQEPPGHTTPTPTSTPVATAAAAPPTGSQLIVALIQNTLRSAGSTIFSIQQSALLALEHQWQGASGTNSALSSVQSLISGILSRASGSTGAAGWR